MSVDITLWNRVAESDNDAFEEVYRYFFTRFYNYGCKFTTDQHLIEDTVQETLLLIWDKRKTLTKIKYVNTYFYSVFRNTLIDKLRAIQSSVSNPVIDEPEFSVEQIIIEREVDQHTKEKLKKSLEALTSRQREAIFLRFYEGLPYDEVASVLSITTKATYKIVARALDQLRQSMVLNLFLVLLSSTRY